jgi:hypothetical protein
MDNRPSGMPAELPSDYRAFRRAYRWPLLYGPWALGLVGLVMIGFGLFVDRPGPVAVTSIGFGAAMVIASVLLPRMQGPLELGPSGVKGAIHGLPTPFMVATVAREAAEQAIPADEPDKERKVDEVVGHTVSEFASRFAIDRELLSALEVPISALEEARRRRAEVADAIRLQNRGRPHQETVQRAAEEAQRSRRKEHGEPPDDQDS